MLRRLDKNAPGGCWLFTGAKNTYGYGTMNFRGRQDVAHRIAWILYRGEIPAGLWVLHKCDVRACCNPEHLFLGDATANNHDMVQKGRHRGQKRTHCPQGHPYSGTNLILNKRKGKTPFRACRICKRICQSNYKRKAA